MGNSRLALMAFSALAAMTSLAIFISSPLPVTHAQSCSPGDSSYLIDRDSCGGGDWELQASYGGTLYDEGEWSAAGDCSTEWTDCNCNNHQTLNQDATKSGIIAEDEGPDGSGGEYYAWWWNLYGYNGWNEPACTSGSCSGSGVKSATPVPNDFFQNGYDEEDGACIF